VEGATPQLPHSIRPGDVLADRYLLVDLLSESGNGRFWRAHDRILERHVAVHCISSEDPDAAAMMAAARTSAMVLDRRILRVLDVEERDGLCYVVNEWGSGTSLDILVANEGPLGPRRAAWVASEVAAAITAAHDAGVAHGRLIPENVLIDESGSVRVIGFSVDAALLGLPPGRLSSDVTDLGGLLYFMLTGRWTGVSRSACPEAPQEGGRVLRPRRVKAGIPRDLDTLCDQVLNPYVATPPDPELLTPRGIGEALRDFVGDTAGMAAAEVAAGNRNGVPSHRTRALPLVPQDPPATTEPTLAVPLDEPKQAAEPPFDQTGDVAGQATPPEPLADAPPVRAQTGPRPPTEQPTVAGLPIFDDGSEDVEWFAARAEVPPPPPPFEEPPERPLFAPEPQDGRPARTTRPNAAAATGDGKEYWPWDTGGATTGSGVLPVTEDDEDKDDEVPGRSWLRLAMGVGACILLLLAIVFAFNLGRGRTPLGEMPEETDSPSSGGSASSSPSLEPLADLAATDFDPQGDPPEENTDLAPLAVDGDPATTWRTVTYDQDLGPGGLKTGVGLTIDLGSSVEVGEVDLTLVGAPTGVSLYLTETTPTGVRDLTPLEEVAAKSRQVITLDEPATGRYLVVWLTSLPALAEGGFRGEVAEVMVRG